MTRILWLSHHEPKICQIAELESVFGEIELVHKNQDVNSANDVLKLMKETGADEVVAVLPMRLLTRLCKAGVQPIRAHMKKEKLPYNRVTFHHLYFERIKNIETEGLGA